MAITLKISFYKANNAIRLFLCLFLSLAAFGAHSQSPGAVKYLETAYRQYLNFQLDSCIKTLSSAPNDPMIRYLEILVNSTEIFISDNRELYKERKKMEAEQLDQLPFSDEFNNFLKSEIKLQWAVLKLKNGDEFSAFWSMRQAYNIAKANVELHPDFLQSYKTLGLLHVLYGIFPDKYNWILALLGIEGNVTQGLDELNKLYESNQFLSLEAGITISMLHAYLLNNPAKATTLMSSIQAEDKHKRLLVDYAHTLVLMKNAQSEEALLILEDAQRRYAQPFTIPQVYYLLGEIYLQGGQLNEAVANYATFLSLQDGKNMVKDANYKIGICHLIQGQEEVAASYFEEAKNVDYAKNEADKNAAMEIDSEHYSHKKLYQLRYATDGGYYELANKFLDEIDPAQLQPADLCEYHYRSARLFHKTGKITNAIERYKKTIDLQGLNSWYFAPNSALQLGLIYMAQADFDQAEIFLKTVTNYKEYPYETSIRQKAKAALKDLP